MATTSRDSQRMRKAHIPAFLHENWTCWNLGLWRTNRVPPSRYGRIIKTRWALGGPSCSSGRALPLSPRNARSRSSNLGISAEGCSIQSSIVVNLYHDPWQSNMNSPLNASLLFNRTKPFICQKGSCLTEWRFWLLSRFWGFWGSDVRTSGIIELVVWVN